MKAGLPDDASEDEAAEGVSARPTDVELLRLAAAAEQQSVSFAQQHWRSAWDASYKAFRSQFQDKSKYKSDDFRHRSKVFRPKTRISVTKDMAGAAQTLFASVETVSISPGDETDDAQIANAELMNALVNYRLDRTSGKAAIPWFLTAMGARQDCQIAGICVSKQYWSFQQREKRKVTSTRDANGGIVETVETEMVTIKDKPEIDLLPPENVGMDPAAHWTDPVNSGAYFKARYPMHIQDVRDMCADPRTKWRLPTDEAVFTKARVREFDAAQVRRAREGGQDRMDNQTSSAREFDVVWVCEWFIRTANEDWCFWTLGTDHMLSEPVTTEEAYPWKGGERPYRIGYGNLEAHRIVPMSPVETLQPLQQEINDITNLRLDNLKQVIQPVAMVKRGKKIDTDALKRRYPVLFVDSMEDVTWDRPPDSAASSFAETSRLDTDFDDLAGTFNGGSVANNRQVGETVGGMRMMSNAAGAVSEFYVRLWVETWVEPVIGDLARLEAYYESDEKILALAAKRAPAMKKFGFDQVTDELLMQQVVVRVSAGLGTPDPMQKLAKIGQALTMLQTVLGASKRFQSGEIRIKEETLINEIMGDAGVRDGFDRFFELGEPTPPPGAMPPEPPPSIDPAELADREAERKHQKEIAALKIKGDITKTIISAKSKDQSQKEDIKHQRRSNAVKVMMDALREHNGYQERAADRLMAQKTQKATSAN